MIHIELGQLFLCKSLVAKDQIESDKFFKLASKEACHLSAKLESLNKDKLVNFFITENPNSNNWHKKGNKLEY